MLRRESSRGGSGSVFGFLLQMFGNADAKEAEEIFFAAGVLESGNGRPTGGAAINAIGDAGGAVLVALRAFVAEEGAEDDGVGNGGGSEDFA